MKINESTKQEIGYYLGQEEKELISLIGSRQHISPIRPLDEFFAPNAEYLRGVNWFEYYEVFFYGKLCIEYELCSKLSQPEFSDEVALVVAIADAICGFLTNIPPFAVAALLIKKGLKNFCCCNLMMSEVRRSGILHDAVIWHITLSNYLLQSERNIELFSDISTKLNLCNSVIKLLYTDDDKNLLLSSDIPLPKSSNAP